MNAEFGYPTQENYEEKEKLSISPLAVSIVNRHFKVGEEALQAFNEISKGNIEKPSGALLFYQKSLLQISTESIIRGKPLSIPEKMDHLRDLDFKAISDEINNGSSPEITTPEETALMFDEFSKTLFNMPGLISSSMLAEDKMPEMIRNAKTIATNVNVPVNAVYDDDKLFSRLV
jgi:hypothetical protein